MKRIIWSMLFLASFYPSIIAEVDYDIYQELSNFGETADQESIDLLEKIANTVGLTDKTFLLFKVRDQFECCGQVFPYTYDDKEYYVVRVWKSLFDELTLGEKKALFAHEMMHVKNGDLKRAIPNLWLTQRKVRLYAMLMSLYNGICAKGGTPLFVRVGRMGATMLGVLIAEMIMDECRILYEFKQSRNREMAAELGGAYALQCAKEAISLNHKIDKRLNAQPTQQANLVSRYFEHIDGFFTQLYASHPNRDKFNKELEKIALKQALQFD